MPTPTPNDVDPNLTLAELANVLHEQDQVGFDYQCECGKPTIHVGNRPSGFSKGHMSKRCIACDPIVAAFKARQDRAAAEHHDRMNCQRLTLDVGRLHQDCSLENYVAATDTQKQAFDAVTGRWWEKQTFLLLCGTPGTGKTHLAVAGYREAQRHRIQPLFVRETQFLQDWRRAAAQRINFDGVEQMTAAPILILDDVATGKFTDGSLELIYQVIDHRSCNLLPTLLTSNLTADGIDARWGEKIVSRILERGHGRMIEIDGQNHRMRAA